MTRKEQIQKEADDFADRHGFRVPYDGSNDFYDKVDVKASMDGFIAGAKWADEHTREGLVDIDKACKWLNDNCRPFIFTEQEVNEFRKAMTE